MRNTIAFVGMGLLALGVAGCERTLDGGPPPVTTAGCHEGQIEVMVLGSFHFAQQNEVDILSERRQAELSRILDRLETFGPDRVTVEIDYDRNDELNEAYQRYLAGPDSLTTTNEYAQIGLRLARRLGHDSVFGVDVQMYLWHDSVAVFDSVYPGARGRLQRKWNVRYPDTGPDLGDDASMAEMLRYWNTDSLPALPEYGRFLPLVEGEVYAGALKLRPWYDRNMRIVQNFFRILDPEEDDRLFMVVGGSHVRVLRQILDVVPQFCSVDPLPYLEDEG
ncbi:MAG: DUF5694 domain-containing protein [Longimicrobiales bacterium]|nr:DUF5694 domain-containing protein [Longimicrobiales bacterium]